MYGKIGSQNKLLKLRHRFKYNSFNHNPTKSKDKVILLQARCGPKGG